MPMPQGDRPLPPTYRVTLLYEEPLWLGWTLTFACPVQRVRADERPLNYVLDFHLAN